MDKGETRKKNNFQIIKHFTTRSSYKIGIFKKFVDRQNAENKDSTIIKATQIQTK